MFQQIPDNRHEDKREPKYSSASSITCFVNGEVIAEGEYYYHLFGDNICLNCVTEEEEQNQFIELRKAGNSYDN